MGFWILTLSLVALALYLLLREPPTQRFAGYTDVLLGPEELDNHACDLARKHKTGKNLRLLNSLLLRNSENFRLITDVYKKVNERARRGRSLSPASEWLLDNYYIVEEQVKEIRQTFTYRDFRNLKILTRGLMKSYPRIYAIALELVAHTDGRIEEQQVISFVNAYQSVRPLTIAEIWALSLMLRLALIENIRGLCEKIFATQKDWEKVERMLAREDAEQQLAKFISELKSAEPAAVEHLLEKLRQKKLDSSAIARQLDQKLPDFGFSVQEVVQQEHQVQAGRKLSVGNSMMSLKALSTLDWNDIYEQLCPLKAILAKDAVYAAMDFESRDYYRRQIQKLARRYKCHETRVARKLIQCVQEAEDSQPTHHHIGWYLIGRGRSQLLAKLRGRSLPSLRLVGLYFVAIGAITGLLTGLAASYVSAYINSILTIALALVAAIPASEIALTIINQLVTRFVSPSFLPKLEYREGIPDHCRTLVVVPALLPNSRRVEELMSQLEVHYLANREPNLRFALLGDFKDAASATTEDDKAIVDKAVKTVRRLNQKYEASLFFYLQRQRVYSQTQQRWMGWERKRGALVELNALLKGAEHTSFAITEGDMAQLTDIRYVITLDADTRLPLDTARKLIGTICHPLNMPVLDRKRGVVTEGYGIIQPRISISLESANRSFFARVFGGHGGVDTYTTAISDVYQDLFGEGIFTGKGIYDLEVFHSSLEQAIPDNAVLSHDLLEGSYTRTGLATDIELIDDFPVKYNAYMMRLHRWTRGDWQLIRWLGRKVPNRGGNIVPNPLSWLSRWKIFDNLRRSLVPLALIILVLAGLTNRLGNPLIWLGFALVTLATPLAMGLLSNRIQSPSGTTIISGPRGALWQFLIQAAFLPYHAWVMFDAVARTLVRVFITGKNLLEWTTAADVEKSLQRQVGLVQSRAVLIALALASLLILATAPRNLFIAAPLFILWFFSPLLAARVSDTDPPQPDPPDSEHVEWLRQLARKTWNYYEDFAGSQYNFLPVDNYQEDPPNGVDNRTSPTNIGFLLGSTLAARDLGYLTTSALLERVDKTLSTVEKLEKWNGHLFNWYDAKTLKVLRPRYVSTVDSGNLVGFLLVLSRGLEEYVRQPLVDGRSFGGLLDTLQLEDSPRVRELQQKLARHGPSVKLWLDTVADYQLDHKRGRTAQLLELARQEIDELFPHTEILTHPPQFLQQENQYSTMRTHINQLVRDCSPTGLGRIYPLLLEEINRLVEAVSSQQQREFLHILKNDLLRTRFNADKLLSRCRDLLHRIQTLVENTAFKPLYHRKRHLFSIGYNVEEEKLTAASYDLLASESRLASYLAIIRREVPRKHWYKLGRSLSRIKSNRGLVSWSGTMFEYLMPALLMQTFENTLLYETYVAVIKAQQIYGQKRKVPWGTSESGYFAFDLKLNYQYRAFGVPELGLKRGLANDMVVSGYSTLLALPFAPAAAVANLHRLVEDGLEGNYGLYEAVDYTPGRVPPGEKRGIVKSFMAHHQGMGLLALVNYLLGEIMVQRFHSIPLIRAGEILLQEKVPQRAIITKENKEPIQPLEQVTHEAGEVVRELAIPSRNFPHCHVLGDTSYQVVLTNYGSGYSRSGHIQLTRWREDLTTPFGSFIYINNLSQGSTWSATYAPLGKKPDWYRVRFYQDRAEFLRNDEGIDTTTRVVVSTEDPVELRQVTLTNHGWQPVEFEVTSYLELVLTDQKSDLAHPAFSNLFVRTQVCNNDECLLASRRPRSRQETEKWAFHTLLTDGRGVGRVQYETNRNRFLGRGRTINNPAALSQPLSGTVGAVLDPIFSLRRRVRLHSGESATLTFITGLAASREKALKLAAKYRDNNAVKRARELALVRNLVESRYLNLLPEEIITYQDLLAHLIYAGPGRRRHSCQLEKNIMGQPDLWALGLSGDHPLVLVTVSREDDMEVVREAIRAHDYWVIKGFTVDLVILNDEEEGYYQPVHDLIREVVQLGQVNDLLNVPGGIYIRNRNHLSEAELALLYSAARIVLEGDKRTMAAQVDLDRAQPALPPPASFIKRNFSWLCRDPKPSGLQLFNGLGGFSNDGSEYVIKLSGEDNTPAPWCNVVANPRLGFIVSERGSSFTWAENSRENKLTVWNNDPVSDPPAEVVYVRDEESGETWSITPAPIRQQNTYIVRHGNGYSRFEHCSHGIGQQQTLFVPRNEPVKLNLVRLFNPGTIPRELTLTYYIRPVLGVSDQVSQQYIFSRFDDELAALAFDNPFNTDFPGRYTFIAASEPLASYTANRTEFIGQGSLVQPDAMSRQHLANTTGAAYDPCGAVQVKIRLEAQQQKELVFMLGQTKDREEARTLIEHYRQPGASRDALREVSNWWRRLLASFKVDTPDQSLDLLLNTWLPYQTISCRLWARSAFYQNGGAYGFRDQLQDAVNVVNLVPHLTREQILLHCAHQFEEGDVQHWWHPGTGNRGVRTKFSDDLLWLPWAVIQYLKATEDYSLLAEDVGGLRWDLLQDDEDERHGEPEFSDEKLPVYEHCVRAIDRSLRFGSHDLPLMGSGDWNDGMSTVGNQGKGESVWLAWFLLWILRRFVGICRRQGDHKRAEHYRQHAGQLLAAVEKHAWDGQWYLRAWFDDGTPLGSVETPECSIDSLAQSWAVLSGEANAHRQEQAMEAVESHLISREEGLVLLFTPPFDNSSLEPGYIKGYVPGVRENGGQYTHAATWVIAAMAALGKGDKAWELFHLINPINHSRTPIECAKYKVEPYVVAADVYAVHPHVGRGGWTWYTGAGAWLYQVGLSSVLGISRRGDRLVVDPCIPQDWPEYTVTCHLSSASYKIIVKNPRQRNRGVKKIMVDGEEYQDNSFILVDDGKKHTVVVTMG